VAAFVNNGPTNESAGMCKQERQSGHGTTAVTIGSVAVPGRWRYSYVEAHELPDNSRSVDQFKFVVALTLSDRKKLVNLKKGDWTTLTAGPFSEIPVYLSDIEYNDGTTKVSLIFTKSQPPSASCESEST
jgi:hypothetical protein